MIEIVLIGTGNVASHLFNAFQKAHNTKIIQVYNHKADSLNVFADKVATTTSLQALKPADVYLVAVKDDVVADVIEAIPATQAIVAHTSGSVPLLEIAAHNGVFYPLQTFSKHTAVDFSKIPLCIEATDEKDTEVLAQLGRAISPKTYRISTAQRKSLHLAAVFTCNFTNHLYRISEKICAENDIPFDILHALIEETALKATLNSPKNVQTGPAKRGDQKTIDFHLTQLKSAELKEIYTLLTRSIQDDHESKL